MDNNKRELIKKIKLDVSMSDIEKNKKIQELMMGDYILTQTQLQSKSNESKTCSHYNKKCYKFYFDCCKTFEPCKRCHIDKNCLHKDNLIVSEISCSQCDKSQKPGEYCIECSNKFANSYCEICQIWTDKDITHCNKCGLCRLGKSDSLYHCDDCGICFNVNVNANTNLSELTNYHQCIKKKLHNDMPGYKDSLCVVCHENIFNSQFESFLLDCGHFIHNECFTQYIKLGSYKCPYCKKSIGDLTSHWNFIREQIKLYPLPYDFLPIKSEDIVDSQYGKFLVKSIDLTNPLDQIDSTNPNIKMYSGEFINWNITNKNLKKNKAQGILNEKSIIKNIYKNIHCNDCGTNSMSKFHYYGLECSMCGSFNTQE